jgi:hypothetical protein
MTSRVIVCVIVVVCGFGFAKADEPIASLSGRGSKQTESFAMSTPKARIVARAWHDTYKNHSTKISLRNEKGQSYGGETFDILSEDELSRSETSIARDLEPGNYFIKVFSNVNWEIEVFEVQE